MVGYIIRRLLLMIPTLIGVTAVVFFIMALSPGGIGGPLLTQLENVDAEESRRIREYYEKRYGINDPAVVQYARWLNDMSPIGFRRHEDGSMGAIALKAPDFGESLARHRPVLDLIAEALPITIMLNVISIPLVYAIGIINGVIAARRRGSWFDMGSGVIFLALWSVPTIWAGVLLIGFLASDQYIRWFPTFGLHDTLEHTMAFLPSWTDGQFQRGWLLDTLWHLVLPVICLSYAGFAFLSKLTRTSMLETLSADFVRTARAKGLTEKVVLWQHVFRNSLLALITVAAGIIPAVLVGSVVVESIFSIPGMGRLGIEAVRFKDRELVMAVTLIGGLIGLFSQLIRDICYAVADPRVSYE